MKLNVSLLLTNVCFEKKKKEKKRKPSYRASRAQKSYSATTTKRAQKSFSKNFNPLDKFLRRA